MIGPEHYDPLIPTTRPHNPSMKFRNPDNVTGKKHKQRWFLRCAPRGGRDAWRGEEGIWRELVELLDDEGSEENEEKSFESLQRR